MSVNKLRLKSEVTNKGEKHSNYSSFDDLKY